MKKSDKIKKIILAERGNITVLNQNNESIKMSRQERKVLSNIKSKTYRQDVEKMFMRSDVFTDDFDFIIEKK